MNEKDKNVTEAELPDDKLNEVSGGGMRKTIEKKAACLRCKKEMAVAALIGGYCPKCYDELKKMGVYISL